MIENIDKKLERVYEIENSISELKKEKDEITAILQAYGLEVLENKNLKYIELSSGIGSCNIGYKEKLSVDNLGRLKGVLGSIAEEKIKITMEPKIEFSDKKFQRALIALYKNEFKEHDIAALLRTLGLEETEIKAAMKKLKGDYFKDKYVLESFGVNDNDLEEELDMIKENINFELISRYFNIDKIDMEELKKSIFVEDTLSVGYKFRE